MENKNYPPFSVLMSVYKKEKSDYLDLSLKSIINQTLKPNEIVLVEDGPIPEKLEKIIMKYKAAFANDFKIIKSSQNQGLGASLRLGTKYVSTNWIARMDTDDYSVPDRFEKQLKVINERPNVAIVGGQVKEFSLELNNIVGQRHVPVNKKEIRDFTKWRSPFNHPTVIINKKALENVGGYVPFGNLEDYYLWARLVANNYDVKNISDVLVYMRVDGGIYSRRGNVRNIKYFYKLRRYLNETKLVSNYEEIFGDLVMSINIIIPSWIREKIYTIFLHRNN